MLSNAKEKLSLAVSALVGPESIDERLGRAYHDLAALKMPGLAMPAFAGHEDLKARSDQVMQALERRPLSDEEAGVVALEILDLHRVTAERRRRERNEGS